MSINYECGFCRDGLVVYDECMNKLIDVLVATWRDKKYQSKKAFYRVNLLRRVSKDIDDYIKLKHPDMYNVLDHFRNIGKEVSYLAARNFLLSYMDHDYIGTFNTGYICCSFCNVDACEYHIIYGGFVFYNCLDCNKNVSICGWCAKFLINNKLCKTCDINKSKDTDRMFIDISKIDVCNIDTTDMYIDKVKKYCKKCNKKLRKNNPNENLCDDCVTEYNNRIGRMKILD